MLNLNDWKEIKAIIELADNLIMENGNILEKYPSEEKYYNTILELFKQTPEYMNQFSVLSHNPEWKPEYIHDIPDENQLPKIAIQKSEETYSTNLAYDKDTCEYFDMNEDLRKGYQKGFFDGGKYILDSLIGTKVDSK